MTKERAPLTYEDALSRVFGLVGRMAAAEVAGVAERTLYDWGQPDNQRSVPINIAEQLDVAYIAAGGQGRPFHDTMAMRLNTAHGQAYACQVQLAEQVAGFAKEAGEFSAEAIRLTLPGSGTLQIAKLRKEAGEAISLANMILRTADALENDARAPPDTS